MTILVVIEVIQKCKMYCQLISLKKKNKYNWKALKLSQLFKVD